MGRRPGRGRKAPPAPHVQEALRRVFVYSFMRPDDFAWAPIDFPGAWYDDDDGVLADGMQAKATAHLIDAIRQQGYEIVFDNPATDPVAVLHHTLWDKWTEDEIGEHQFIGRLFNERGQIYRGCTAFDAANYTLQRLAALDGEIRSRTEPPVQLRNPAAMTITSGASTRRRISVGWGHPPLPSSRPRPGFPVSAS